MTDVTTERRPAGQRDPRWTDNSDKGWPVEVVPAWAYDRLLTALRRIVSEGDYTAPEGMKRIANEAIDKAEGRS